ncbi:MAG: hypothetical protein H0W50_08455 [Parachlamydiaceae bacterium]|nr:hypothetical protein [Parachlamydiaceae bacterium]
MHHIQNRFPFSLIDIYKFTDPIIYLGRQCLGLVSAALAAVSVFFLRLIAGDGPKLSLNKGGKSFDNIYGCFVPKRDPASKQDDNKKHLINSLILSSEELINRDKYMAMEQDLNEDEVSLLLFTRSWLVNSLLFNLKKVILMII